MEGAVALNHCGHVCLEILADGVVSLVLTVSEWPSASR